MVGRKLKKKNVQRALNSDIANCVVEETQNKAKKKTIKSFWGRVTISKGVSNFQIENAIKNIRDEDMDDNFVGVFPSNHINKFINHVAMISEKQGKYSFIIANTNSSEKGGIHWWSILDIEPKTDIFFFDSFGLDGLKHFIIRDGRNVVEKVLFETEKMTKTDKRITYFNKRFNFNTYKNLSVQELDAQNYVIL